MKTCKRCEHNKPETDFPYLKKGKQAPNAPRQDVCRPCRSVLHARKYERLKRAEWFDAHCMDYRLRTSTRKFEPFRWKLTKRQKQEIALMNELFDVQDLTESGWLDLCAEVAV